MGAFYNEGWTWLDLGCRGIDWVYLVCYTWPVFTLVLIGLLIVQWLRIRRLTRTMGNTR